MAGSVKAIVFDVERRQEPRLQAEDTALTFLQGRSEAVSCVVKDFSDTGARIFLDETCFIPKNFKLYIDEKQVLAECEQMWRKGHEVGLKFRSVVKIG